MNQQLYDAMLGYVVAENSQSNSWQALCAYAFLHNNLDELDATEDQVKKDYGLTSMPAAWRSAKSTVTKALKAGVGLVDENGNAVPKNTVYTKTKIAIGSKAPTDVDTSVYEAFRAANKLLLILRNNPGCLSPRQVEVMDLLLKNIGDAVHAKSP